LATRVLTHEVRGNKAAQDADKKPSQTLHFDLPAYFTSRNNSIVWVNAGRRRLPDAFQNCSRRKSARRVILNHELYFTGHGDLSTLRAANQASLELVEFNLEVTRNRWQNLCVPTGSSYLERLKAFALGL